mgnify:FL=1
MKASRFLIATTKETPADAVVKSHQLMLRAGMIRKIAAGLYTWLPLGVRVLQKVQTVIRQEMNQAGAQEVLMPVFQPAELWHETGRWEKYGPELLRMKDRHNRDFVAGPTHEEVITELTRNELTSYKQLPMNLYQIQTKFRDEVRPRFGVMRSREFIMKDAYSFHADQEGLMKEYQNMYDTYCRIFDRLQLDYRPVMADSGSIGGAWSHEFHVLADSGEDDIAFSSESDYAANVELAEAVNRVTERPAPGQEKALVDTPNEKTIAEVCKLLGLSADQTVKTLLVKGTADEDGNQALVALVLRGDHELNDIKAEKLPEVAAPMEFASDAEVKAVIGVAPGSIGPQELPVTVIADRAAAVLADFCCGANQEGKHFTGANWERDCHFDRVEDLRNVVAGDLSPDGKGELQIKRGIEVGHIFDLGKVYSEPMKATVLDQNGKDVVMTMGCYGIGVTRVVAAAIEQNHDDKGIIWPEAIAPFHVGIVPLNAHKSEQVTEIAEKLYQQLQDLGLDVYLDDRDKKTSPGVKFADLELIGVPHRIVVSDRGLKEGEVEYKGRRDAESTNVSVDDILEFVQGKMSK